MSYAQSQASFATKGWGATSRVAPVSVTLPANGMAVDVNFNVMPNGQQISTIASMYVDNTAGPLPIVISFSDTQMEIDVPAFDAGYYPVFTNSLGFRVFAPLQAEFGVPFTVEIQAFDQPIQPFQQGATLPAGNSGSLVEAGNPGGWNLVNTTVPLSPAGVALVYSSLEINNSAYSQPVTVSGTGLDGNPWTVTAPGFTDVELAIPLTASGTIATVSTATPTLAGTTTALIPLRWRVQPAGIVQTSSLPTAQTSFTVETTAPAAGNNDGNLALPATFGAFVSGVTVAARGLSNVYKLELIDNTGSVPPATVFWALNFPTADLQESFPVGWATKFRGGNVLMRAIFTGASAGVLDFQIQWSPVSASQNG